MNEGHAHDQQRTRLNAQRAIAQQQQTGGSDVQKAQNDQLM